MSSENVERWRKRTKAKIVAGFGGACNKCGYDLCMEALDLHHIDPIQKDFNISNIFKCPKAWDKVVLELNKCILLCCRCHREFHYELWKLEDIQLNEFSEEKCGDVKELATGTCPICNKSTFWGRKACSKSCSARMARNVNWPSNEEVLLLAQNHTYAECARKLDVSLAGFKKHIKRIKTNYLTE